MGTAERKERDKQEMRRLILQAAKKLFAEEGFEKVNIRRIAQAIEYSVGTIYLYFEDKDEILHALHVEGFEELYRRQQAIFSITDPLERLREHAYIYVNFGLENPDYYHLMFISMSQAKKIEEKQEWKVGNRTYRVLEDNIRDCLQAGAMADQGISAEAITFATWAIVHGLVSLIIRGRALMCEPQYQQALVKDCVDFLINSVRTGKPSVS